MEGADYPSGWPHRHKRSRAQMEEYDRSRSPSWFTNALSQPGETHLSAPFYRAFEQQRDAPAGAHASFYEQDEASNSQTDLQQSSAQPASSAQPNMSGLHPPEPEITASASRRFPGDGFDYRRPARLTREATVTPVDLEEEEDDLHIDLSRDEDVIDLTADDSGYGASQDDGQSGRQNNNSEGNSAQPHRERRARNARPRLPRGMDIIIDLDNGHEEWRLDTPPAPEPGSPELEFISSRPIQTPRAQSLANNSDGDEVQFLREQPLSQAEVLRRRNQGQDAIIDLLGNMNGRFPHLRAQVNRFNAQVRLAAAAQLRAPPQVPRAPLRTRGGHVHYRLFEAPALDFDMVGFDMGMEAARPEPPAPTYNAPEKAAEGFTRSPQENDVLVCPNCDCELCAGEDEVKQQVWIVKACGHVYCGECATNRSASKKSQKGKERTARTKPFQWCVVEGCEKKVVNSKTMVQVFL